MKNITTLRNHLFDQLERLAQATNKEEIEKEVSKTKEVINISDAILRTATVEANVMGAVKTLNSAFIPDVLQEVGLKQLERKKKPYEFQKPKEISDNEKNVDDLLFKHTEQNEDEKIA